MAKPISQTTGVSSFLIVITTFSWLFWSYGLVDRNLTFTSWPPYLSWQNWSWQWSKTPLIVVSTFVCLAIVWSWVLTHKKSLSAVGSKVWWFVVGALTLSYNALSHDIFNYLFNAKMVLQYSANPHASVALDFPADTWLRFMHNVHTPAPYAYGWTALSLLPSLLSGQKFILAYLFMKVWMLIGFLLTLWAFRRLLRVTKSDPTWLHWLGWQPLLLLETLMNGHNDVWMMWPAILAFSFLFSKRTWKNISYGLGLLLFSASIKYVTLVLIPIYLGYFLVEKYWPKKHVEILLRKYWGDLVVMAMLAPLLTARSQQFHPWYLIWALVFVPFVRSRKLRFVVQGLAATSLVRYVPWLWANQEYTASVQLWSRVITWSGVPLGLLVSRFRK